MTTKSLVRFVFTTLCFIAFFSIIFSNSQKVWAANFYFEPEKVTVATERLFQVNLMVRPERGQSLNAVEGQVLLSAGVSVKEIKTGGSVIPFWVNAPELKDGQVYFSGLIPGGLGTAGSIFTLVLKGESLGLETIEVLPGQVLLNDGQGTQIEATGHSFEAVFVESAGQPESEISVDTTAPENFTPIVTRDPLLFDNQWFLIFATQDKESGIAYYEVLETKTPQTNGAWVTASSPYLLTDQRLTSYIYVKAVDGAGNQTIAVIEPAHETKAWYSGFLIFAILLLFSVAGWFGYQYLLKNKLRKIKDEEV